MRPPPPPLADIVVPVIVILVPAVNVSCFASKAVLICADVDGFVLLLLGALNVKVACFASICVCRLPNVFVTFVAKLPELSRADANSLNVSNAPGAPFTKLETAVDTKAVVASCVVFVRTCGWSSRCSG